MTLDETFDRAESAVGEGRGLAGTGFWPAVAQLRTNDVLAVRYGDRVADIDRRAFERGVRLRVAIGPGVAALTLGTLLGVAAIVVAGRLEYVPQAIVFLTGFVLLLLSTHALAHFVVGRLLGIRFTHVFVAGRPPEPGAKIDYASYLRTAPTKRAFMHASGAVVSKIVPFALVPFVFTMDAWPGAAWILIGIGVISIFTDIFLSTKVSDWKRVKREVRAARRQR